MAAAKRTPIQVGDTVTNGARTGTATEVNAVSARVEFEDGTDRLIEKKLWKVVTT